MIRPLLVSLARLFTGFTPSHYSTTSFECTDGGGYVLQIVTSRHKKEFVLADVYANENALAKLHPNNSHIRDKIRQQLQVLRDMGLLAFLGSGSYLQK